MKIRSVAHIASFSIALMAASAVSQTPAAVPSAPAASPSAAPAVPADPFPAADPKFFTAKSPTVDTVNAFLKQLWGYDATRAYRVMGIQPTAAAGVARVTVYVATPAAEAKVQPIEFYVLPDGKHAIAEGAGVVAFGAAPFAATAELLRSRADGATRGAASKALELVEFADLQCPHCKDAQPVMDQIVKDFPKAHVVFQLFPLVDIHPSAFKAAAYGVCVQKQSNDAFFKYADAVFAVQETLTPATDDALLKTAAANSGVNADTVAACASSPATKQIVDADIKLAFDAEINETPTLAVNGRVLPLTSIPYDVLKQIIQYQATLDGVDSGATAETLAGKSPQPVVSDLPK
ncbi:MAG TPA: thioredoxin domain-containing protein [Acidobacteriaceae bacterium]|nr:thioredoxin domain-containing protein [Acidobacteriaceae bacterium]